MKKIKLYSEAAYVIGIILLAFGTAFMEKADFGVSMIAAPAYILHLKISQFLPFFSFGMANYTIEALLLVIMIIVLRKVKITYLFSFATAVIYGFALDAAVWTLGYIPFDNTTARVIFYIVGMPLCSSGVAFLFRTYFSPEVYDLFVKEVTAKFNLKLKKFKTAYDCTFCLVSVILSFSLFGFMKFEGINVGTVICALLNGTLITFFSKLIDKRFEDKDLLPLRKYF